jgi:hypothetical protein
VGIDYQITKSSHSINAIGMWALISSVTLNDSCSRGQRINRQQCSTPRGCGGSTPPLFLVRVLGTSWNKGVWRVVLVAAVP